MPDLSHLKKLLQSKNKRVMWVGVILAFCTVSPVVIESVENPDKSTGEKVGSVLQIIGYTVGGIFLLSLPPEELEDGDDGDEV